MIRPTSAVVSVFPKLCKVATVRRGPAGWDMDFPFHADIEIWRGLMGSSRPRERGLRAPGALPADLHALRFHDLRHTCAALGIEAGRHPALIQQQLGHSSITVTLDR
ncbi:MAG TPA: tyrosine-type recombinase/integrase [Microbacteriaceae bacterium]|jgi:integrase|nr:tyrosine-type recombinase/integrase [Microbacteriaceae bacterium]